MATSAPKAAKPGEKPAPSQETGAAPTNKRKKLFIIAGAALLVAIGAAGGWLYFTSSSQNGAAAAKAKTPPPPAPPVFLALETFTVNLQAEDMQQFLQVGMTLQVDGESEVELIKSNMPQIRNRLLLLLSSKKAVEILSVEGKQKLSAEILEQVRQPFVKAGPKPKVSGVFFTSFVVQ